ncbi:hypothetical protein VTJ04DRAFT_10272 [Mycothermus thermophilus]|uniref:uncharacterized protein n=1 Tax=Humicola insolens TaxID=85995 RepID=UPI0037444AA0
MPGQHSSAQLKVISGARSIPNPGTEGGRGIARIPITRLLMTQTSTEQVQSGQGPEKKRKDEQTETRQQNIKNMPHQPILRLSHRLRPFPFLAKTGRRPVHLPNGITT